MSDVQKLARRVRAMRAHLEDQPMTHADDVDLATLDEAAAALTAQAAEIERLRGTRLGDLLQLLSALHLGDYVADQLKADAEEIARLKRARDEAQAKERERCAKIADGVLAEAQREGLSCSWEQCASQIAAAIRGGSDEVDEPV